MHHRPMPTAMRASLLVWLLAAGAAGQERATTVGRFVGLDAEPVAGATVTFATSPPLVYDAFTPTETTTATTDDRGRFRVSLRTGTAYSVWAIGPLEAGVRERSAIENGVITGNVIELTAKARDDRSQLRILGVDELVGVPPHRLLVRTGALHGPLYSIPIDDDGAVALPELPAGRHPARIVDAEGRVAYPLSLPTRQVTVPTPIEVTVRVADVDGEPIAGAEIAQEFQQASGSFGGYLAGTRHWPCHPVAARTDTAGQARFLANRFYGELLVRAPGYAESVAGRLGGRQVEDGKLGEMVARGPTPSVEAVLHRAPPLTGRLHDGGTALAGAGVWLGQRVELSWTDGASRITAGFFRHRTTRTDEHGNFAFDGRPRDAVVLHFAIDAGGLDGPRVLWLPRPPALDLPPLDLDLATTVDVTFRIVDVRGNPGMTASLALFAGTPGFATAEPIVLYPDRGGRVRARLEPGTWFVYATDGDGACTRRFVVPADPSTEITTELSLQPLLRMSGRLLRPDGSPVHAPTLLQAGMSSEPLPADATDEHKVLREHYQWITAGLLDTLRTGDDGAFELRFLPLDGVSIAVDFAGVYTNLRAATDIELRTSK